MSPRLNVNADNDTFTLLWIPVLQTVSANDMEIDYQSYKNI